MRFGSAPHRSGLFAVALVLGGFVCGLGHASVVVAQSDAEAAARAHYERGITLYDEGQFPAALAEFEAAYQGSHRASLLFNIGQIHARLGHAVEAVDSLRRYLAEASSVSAERRALVESEIAAQEGRIATVTVTVSVPGATVSFDDLDVGQAPLAAPLRVASGEHVIVARADGFEIERFRFRIAGGERREVSLELVPHIAESARLRLVIGVPGAEVRVDGRSIGLSPIELPVGLPAGQHRIEVTRPGYEPLERTVVLAASGEDSLQLDLVRAIQPPSGVMTRVALALPSTSHSIHLDGVEVPAGTRSVEVPFGLHDLTIEGEDMLPVRQRIDVPQGPTYAFDLQYQWEPTHRESLRSQAADVRMGALITMVVGGVVGLGGGAMLIGREQWRSDTRLTDRIALLDVCRDIDRAPCEDMIRARFAPEGDLDAFVDTTNSYIERSEALAVSAAVLIGAGSAALVTGLIVFFLPPSDEQIDGSTTVHPTVSLDAGLGGLSVHGTF